MIHNSIVRCLQPWSLIIKFWRITKKEYSALSRNYETLLPKEALVIGFVTVTEHQGIFLVFLFYLSHTFEFLKLKPQGNFSS